jgi:hypothetical protein
MIELSHETPRTIAVLTVAIQNFRDTGAAPVLLPIFLLVAQYPNRTCAELARLDEMSLSTMSRHLLVLALQLPFLKIFESMGNHDSKIVGADRVD